MGLSLNIGRGFVIAHLVLIELIEVVVMFIFMVNRDLSIVSYWSDMSATAFIEPLPVIEFVAQVLGKDVYSRPLSDADRVKV